MKKRYFLRTMICAVLIFSGFGLSYANNTCLDNEKNISSSLSDLNNAVKRIDINNLPSEETFISESETSQPDDQALESEVCKEVREAAQPSSAEQVPPAALAENKAADNSNLFDFLEEFSFIKEMQSSIAELASK